MALIGLTKTQYNVKVQKAQSRPEKVNYSSEIRKSSRPVNEQPPI